MDFNGQWVEARIHLTHKQRITCICLHVPVRTCIYWLTETQHQFAHRIDTLIFFTIFLFTIFLLPYFFTIPYFTHIFTIIKTLASMNAVMRRNRLLMNCFNRRLFVWLFHKSMYSQCSQVVYHDIVTSLSNTRVHRIVCLYPWLTSSLYP